MAKKIYLVDSTGYDFFICEFEGMGSDNRPRLTIITPGRPVENFLTHLDYYGEDYKDYYLLGEEGKQVWKRCERMASAMIGNFKNCRL